VSQAREAAREHLRKWWPFVWNATNISRQIRELSINLFAQNREHTDPVLAEVI
jgi:hypothetical protein